jgi:hypothetical protein
VVAPGRVRGPSQPAPWEDEVARDRRDGERSDGTTGRPALHLVGDRTEDRGGPGDEDAAAGAEERSRRGGERTGAEGAPSSLDEARSVLADVEPAQYHRVLSGLSREGHTSLLAPLPYSPGLEFQDPATVVLEPKPTGLDTIELYARAAYPDWDRVMVAPFRAPEVVGELDALHHLLIGEGANVALVTNHGQIIDIALVLGALIAAMCEPERTYGVLGERIDLDALSPRINMMISRMVTTRQIFNVPALQILQQCGARLFLSVPQTASRRRVKLDPAVVTANNVLVRHELDLRLAEGGQLLAMAASGSQDLSLAARSMQKVRTQFRQRRGVDPGERDTLHLQPLYDGTMQLMLSCRYVMPVAVSLNPTAPALVVGGVTRVREKDDCHRIMEWIADAHQEATSTPTIYHRHEDDLLTQIRQLVKL